jgi:hypothetical protein
VWNYPRHLVLAHALLKDHEAEAAVQRLIKAKRSVVLDNGAYEGELANSIAYLKLAERLQPAIVILPDIVGAKAERSRKEAMKFYDRAKEVLPLTRFMYVPQGASKEDVLEEFKFQNDTSDKDMILGIGKCYLYWGETSSNRVHMVEDIVNHIGEENIRNDWWLLGTRRPPVSIKVYPGPIMAMDTFKPIREARADFFSVPDARIKHTHAGTIPDTYIEKAVTKYLRMHDLPFDF